MANAGGVQYSQAYGTFTYGDFTQLSGNNPSVTTDTLFDLAEYVHAPRALSVCRVVVAVCACL